MVAAVLGEVTFNRLCKSGSHLFGRRYEAEAYEEARPDAFCNRRSRWGHIAPHCSADPRRSICAEDHTTHDHRCSVKGRRAGRGRGCPHETTKCANCKGPRGARAEACAAKQEARQLAWRWKSPPRPRRERRGTQAAPKLPKTRPRSPRKGKRRPRRRLRRGSPQRGRDGRVGGPRGGRSVCLFVFVLYWFPCVALFFGGYGGKEIGYDSCELGTGFRLKGGKMGCCL